MATVTIFHNNRCSKSRCALGILEDRKIDFEVRKYLEEVPTAEELKDILKKLGLPAKDLIRKGEKIYKELYKGEELSEEEWIQAMVEHPILIQRPIIIKGNRAVIGRPAEKMDEIL